MKKIACAVGFLGIMTVSIAAFILTPKKTYSENENRYLATKPTISLDSVKSGIWQSDLEKYLSDQTPLRDFFMGLRTEILTISGRKEIGGAYIGKDGYDFEVKREGDIDKKVLSDNAGYIYDFLDFMSTWRDSKNCSVMVIPTKEYVLSELLPEGAAGIDQEGRIGALEETFADYNFVDVSDSLLANADKGVFFKTDHHWTVDGAYLAYRKLLETMGEKSEAKYQKIIVADDFKGTLYSKLLNLNSEEDEIAVVVKNPQGMTIEADGKTLTSMYSEEALSKKDKYQYYMGGNYGLLEITVPHEIPAREDDLDPDKEYEEYTEANTNWEKDRSERVIMVIKDSYANAFIPFLTEKYDRIIVIDPRYYGGNVKQLAVDKLVDEVLVLYNLNNLTTDKNLIKIARENVEVPQFERPTEKVNVLDIMAGLPENTVEIKVVGGVTYYNNIAVVNGVGYEAVGCNEKTLAQYADVINSATEWAPNVYDIMVPKSSEICFPDNLKINGTSQKWAIETASSYMNEKVRQVPVYGTLMAHRDEYIYFRSDHHWTALGAYYAYEMFCKVKGVEAHPLDYFEQKTSAGFLGTFYQETQSEEMYANKDSVTVYIPRGVNKMTITDNKDYTFEWPVASDPSTYKGGTKYSSFIGGDNKFSTIHNPQITDGSACVIIKESYGNAFVPFLVDHYEYVYVVDYRYYTGSLKQLVSEKNISDVIYLNNLSAVGSKFLVGKMSGIE